MDASKKTNLLLLLVAANLSLAGFTWVAQVRHFHLESRSFETIDQLQTNVTLYRQAAEKLQEERWINLMNRLEELDKKVDLKVNKR